MQENIFKADSAPAADGEEVDNIKFRVENLLILGMMYCKCDRKERVEAFFMHLVPGLEDQISCGDKDLEHAFQMMGKISYGAILKTYNEEHEANGSDLTRYDLVPENIDLMNEAYKKVLREEDTGFLDQVFGYNTRLEFKTFTESVLNQHYNFL